MARLSENDLELFAVEQINSLGWGYIHGSVISPEGEKPERKSYEQIILTDRLRKAVTVINPHIPQEAQEQAIQKYFAFIHRIFFITTKHFISY